MAVLGLSIAVVSGCGAQQVAPPERESQIQDVAGWYQGFRRAHRRQAPPNEAAFVAFITKTMKEREVELNVDELLTSPRDGQKYVILYGKPFPRNMDESVVAHEKEGYNGKKLVAFESTASREVDDSELQALLARK